MIVLASRNLETGRFEAFEITDKTLIERARSALREDLRYPDHRSHLGLGMSVNHALAFRSADGEAVVYKILGDRFIVSGSKRYPAKQIAAVLKAAHSQGKAAAITADKARSLVPALSGYLQ